MPHNPNEDFDQHLLEIIEHSPTGSVPSTPFHQDGLNRLRASHQVYPDADHKDGYVTARSLAGRPAFHAANLDDLVGGRISAEALEPNAAIFDRYIRSLPAERHAKAEARRLAVAGRPVHHRAHGTGVVPHDPVHSLILVPGSGPHAGLPGNYLFGSVYETGAKSGPWSVILHDSDDGAALFEAASMGEALAKVQEILSCAPFTLEELEALGFKLI
jgi:hypothetical protein